MSANSSKIKDFYKNQTIFLTGGSGFLGKILIEKLLRECDNLKKIYVLIRHKKGKSPEQRFDELFSFACFDRLKAMNKDVFKKVHLIIGDCLEPLLGLSDQDVDNLIKQTTCVIHAAANVKFDQSLKEAASNVRATRDILELAKQMKKLQVFVYVSTAYSNCIYSHIKEDFYPPLMKADKLLSLINSLDNETLKILTPHLLKDCPNTYIFSKSISEDLVRAASEFLSIAVVRPAIVISTISEPMPGWIDNFYGVVGVTIAAALGVITNLHGKLDAKANIVPVDYIANCVLVAAWKNANSTTPTIYNYVGHKNNLLTWGSFIKTMESACWKVPTKKIIWYSSFKITENKIWHRICIFFLHTVLAYVVDFVLFCIGKPTLAVKNYQRLNKLLDLISYFSSKSWEFDDDHVMALWNDMTEEDKKTFNFNMKNVDWDEYFYNCAAGARKHLLKDTSSYQEGGRKLKILFVLHYLVAALWWFLVYKFAMFILRLLI